MSSIKDQLEKKLGKEKFDAAIKAVKDIFAAPPAPPAPGDPKANCTDYPMEGGQVLTVNGELKEGSDATIVTENNSVPAPDGDYQVTMPDGTANVISVASGKITKITPVAPAPEAAAPEAPAPMDAAKMAADIKAAVESALSEHKSGFAAQLKEAIEPLKKENESLRKALADTFHIVEQIAELPSGESMVEKSDKEKFAEKKADKIKDLSNRIAEVKKTISK